MFNKQVKIGLVFFLGIIIMSTTTIAIKKTLKEERRVQIENYTIPVNESGIFLVYEIDQEKVEIREYPSFYFNSTQLPVGAIIYDSQGQSIGSVVGHHQNNYPITPRTNRIMYCGNYGLERLVGNRYIQYRGVIFLKLRDFLDEYQLLGQAKTLQCYIDMFDYY